MRIGRKVYYELSSGNIILDTGERSGAVVETTREQDFETYLELAGRIADTVGMVKFEYGAYSEDFTEGRSIIGINTNTLTPLFNRTPSGDPEEDPTVPPLSMQLEELKERVANSEVTTLDAMDATFDLYLLVMDLQSTIGGS